MNRFISPMVFMILLGARFSSATSACISAPAAAVEFAQGSNSLCPSGTVTLPFDTGAKIFLSAIMLMPIAFGMTSAYFSDASRKENNNTSEDIKNAWLASEIMASMGAFAGLVSLSTFIYASAVDAPLKSVLMAGEIAAGIGTLINAGNGVATTLAFHHEGAKSSNNQITLGFAWAAFGLQALIYNAFRVI